MNMAITEGIEVEVSTKYDVLQSDPHLKRFLWSYHISIQNRSEYTVQLLRRHWFIYDALAGRREVKGEGVIGLQPIIHPGEAHDYTSWCPFSSDIGMMKGYFEMVRGLDGKSFAVRVPDFTVCTPSLNN